MRFHEQREGEVPETERKGGFESAIIHLCLVLVEALMYRTGIHIPGLL